MRSGNKAGTNLRNIDPLQPVWFVEFGSCSCSSSGGRVVTGIMAPGVWERWFYTMSERFIESHPRGTPTHVWNVLVGGRTSSTMLFVHFVKFLRGCTLCTTTGFGTCTVTNHVLSFRNLFLT